MEGKTIVKNVPFRRSIKLKYALTYLALVLAVLLLMNTYPIFTAQNLVFQSKQTSLQNQASLISSTLSSLESLTDEGVSRVMEMLDEHEMSRILIVDTDGMVLYDSEGESDRAHYALIREVEESLNGNDVFSCQYRNGAFRSSASTPIMYRNHVIGAVYLYEYDSEQGEIITGLSSNLTRISLVVIAAALLTSFILSRTMTRRISLMLQGIGSLQEGEYSTRVDVSGKDELSELAGAFNDLTERLETTDEVRKRFVADASHELKTPLASIRLLADSITQNPDMDMETVQEFVSDIGSEADRLNRITEHLLALTRMDNGRIAPWTAVDLTRTIASALHMLSPLAEEKGVVIHSNISGTCVVEASEDEMYQVLFNLVENAIKYNVPDGAIWVDAKRDDENIEIIIADSGIGIPHEDQERIFDRFYRVDKARSREAGGTGLGLSIVHDTIALHGGTVTCADRPGGGSVFTVTLPAF